MRYTREQIMTALFAYFVALAPFQTTGRKVLWYDQVTAFPALFLRHTIDRYPHREVINLPAAPIMEADLFIYCSNPNDSDVAPETQINDLVDAVERSLTPSPVDGFLRLPMVTGGQGLVAQVTIEGEIVIATNDGGTVGMATIPFKILTPT